MVSTEQDWYLSMLGVTQYRQGQSGVPLFAPSVPSVRQSARPDSASSAGLKQPELRQLEGKPPELKQSELKQSELKQSNASKEPLNREGLTAHTIAAASLANILDTLESDGNTPVKLPVIDNSVVATASNTDDSTEEQAEETASFSILCWHVSDDLLVMNHFPYGRQASEAERELLNNILRALMPFSGELLSTECIEWPMNPGADSALSGAKVQLSMFLQGRYKARPYRWLLAMGEELPLLLDTAKGQNDMLPFCPVQAVCIPSLQDLLSEPLKKREAWQAMRFMRDFNA